MTNSQLQRYEENWIVYKCENFTRKPSLENDLNKKFTIWTFSVACFLAMLDGLCLRVLSGIKLVYGQISQEIMGFTNTCMKNSFCKLYMRRIFLLWMNETPTLFFSVFFIRIKLYFPWGAIYNALREEIFKI